MKKEIYHYPVVYLIIPICISLLGIIFGSFFDLKLSDAIVDTTSGIGSFIESFGMVISFFMIPLTGVMVFKGLWHREKTWMKVVASAYLLLCIGMGIYECSIYLIGTTKIKEYGIVFTPWLGYLLSAIFTFMMTAFFFYFIKSDGDTNALIIKGLIILFVLLSQTLIISLLKKINCRPRYRFVTDDEINKANEVFRSWWEFKPFSTTDDYHKSWPSGHTGLASVYLLFPLINDHIRFPFRHSKVVLYAIGLLHPLIVAFYRVRYGAHFLTDVSFAMLITSLIILFYLSLSEKTIVKAMKNKPVKTEEL